MRFWSFLRHLTMLMRSSSLPDACLLECLRDLLSLRSLLLTRLRLLRLC